jgi:hypothetical protein
MFRFGTKQILCGVVAAVLMAAGACMPQKKEVANVPSTGGAVAETPKTEMPKSNVAPLVAASVIKVELKKADGKWQLLRGGQPYFIKGGGGENLHDVLAASGGNSFRTWGVDNAQKQLDEAQKLGLTVALGFWVPHKDDKGFSFENQEQVNALIERFKEAVRKHKDHPALLVWGIGNEMENNNDTPAMWGVIEKLAKVCKEIDPNHPTMTVIAELGKDGVKAKNLHAHCPSIDIVGLNSYAGGSSVGKRYRDSGATKPYIITEFGPFGQWEMWNAPNGAKVEPTSTEKAKTYRSTYEESVIKQSEFCLGSYAFLWGNKVEATATWFGMFLPDGTKVNPVDTITELWTGKPPEFPCPVISKISLNGKDAVEGGATVKPSVTANDPKGGKLTYQWTVALELANYNIQGPDAKPGQLLPETIVKNGEAAAEIKLPNKPGIYRITCYIRNANGGAALGSVPVKVN